MAIPAVVVGTVATADYANSWFLPVVAYKTADESVTSSTTLQNDDDLALAVAASATYIFRGWLNYEGAAGTGDLKIGWTYPSGLTMAYGHIGETTGAAISTGSVTTTSAESNNPNFGGNGAGTATSAYLFGMVFVSTTAGTLQLQWAQASSTGTATKMKKGSWLELRRVG